MRQLENLIKKLVITSGDVIGIDDLPEGIYTHGKKQIKKTAPSSLNEAVEQAKREMVRTSY